MRDKKSMKATTVEDVILGEARAGDAEDMAHIASVITNRARMLGVTPEQVVQNSREFNAYGKPLPRGVDRYRDKARAALNQVTTQGPVTDAMFYATPSAQGNLPKGLSQTSQTNGHVYFTDPQSRPINTAIGTRKLNMQAQVTPRPRGLEAISGIMKSNGDRFNNPKAKGGGLADLLPKAARIEYQLEGKGRSQIPTSGIDRKVAESFNRAVPGGSTVLLSGMEPQGRLPVGAKDRHPRGFAGDFEFRDPNGKIVTNDLILKQVAMDMAGRHRANIGYDNVNYMGPGKIHIDTMPLDQFEGGAQWGRTAKGWQKDLDFFRQSGAVPPPLVAPNPTPRPNNNPMPQRPITPTPQPRSAIASAARELLGVPQAQAQTMPSRAMPQRPVTPTPTRALPPDRPMITGAQRVSQIVAPQSNFTPPSRPASMTPAPSLPQLQIAPLPVKSSPAMTPASMAAQYSQYRPMVPQMPAAPVQNVQVPQLVSAPFPNRPRQSFNPKQAALGAVAGGAVGGLGGAIGGGMFGNKMANASAVNSAFGLKPQSMLSRFSGMFSGGQGNPQPTSFVTGKMFAGGGAQASGYVQGGGAPVGTAYRDSLGGTSVSGGNGFSDRTDRFGNTLRTFEDGRTASVISNKSKGK